MKTRFDRGSSNDLHCCCRSRCLLTVCDTAFVPPSPTPASLMEAKLELSAGFLCVCLLISAPLSSFQYYNHFLDIEKQSLCAVTVCHSICIYLSLFMSVNISLWLSLSFRFLLYQSCSISTFSLAPTSFVLHPKHPHNTQQSGLGYTCGLSRCSWFWAWCSSQKKTETWMCSNRLLQLLHVQTPPFSSRHTAELESYV